MKILFGLHGVTHTEIAQAEIEAFQKSDVQTEACPYGNWGAANGFVNSIKLVFKNAADLKKKAVIQKSDIVYLNTALDTKTLIRDSITTFILKKHNKALKVVLKFHGSQSSTLFSKGNILRNYIFKNASLLLVLSQEEKNNFLSIGVPKEKIQVTANVIDKSLYVQDSAFKNKNGLAADTNLLLFVGRFMKEKGILDLVEACRLLKQQQTNFILFCLGNGPLVPEVTGLIEKYGLKDNIKLLGHIHENETRGYYANCDILILPTYHQEGFPMAVFQAVGAGKAVITTKIRAAADYFVEFENCLWVEKQDPHHLCQQIHKLMNDKKLQKKIKVNNLLLAEKFSAEKIVNKLLDYFNKI